MHTRNNAARTLLPLLVLVLSSTGCATRLPPPPAPVQAPRVQPPPAELMEPPQPGSWSDSVRQRLLQWQKLLTMPKQS